MTGSPTPDIWNWAIACSNPSAVNSVIWVSSVIAPVSLPNSTPVGSVARPNRLPGQELDRGSECVSDRAADQTAADGIVPCRVRFHCRLFPLFPLRPCTFSYHKRHCRTMQSLHPAPREKAVSSQSQRSPESAARTSEAGASRFQPRGIRQPSPLSSDGSPCCGTSPGRKAPPPPSERTTRPNLALC